MSIILHNNLFSSQSIEPFFTYHFVRGLTLRFINDKGILMGVDHSLDYWIPSEYVVDGIPMHEACLSIVKEIESIIKGRLIAAGIINIECEKNNNEVSKPIEYKPDRILLNINDKYLSDADLGGILLSELNRTEDVCRKILTCNGIDDAIFKSKYDMVLFWKNEIKSGRLDSGHLDALVIGSNTIKKAFFLVNMIEIGESIRSSILRANYHLLRMTELIWNVNKEYSTYISSPSYTRELISMGPDVDRIADEYVSSVLASYSTLDMLYEYFVYLTRIPFGEPHFPKNLHFPDIQPSSAFKFGGLARVDDIGTDVLPFSIPNLTEKKFSHLRLLRNDLVHNMVADSHRPIVYIGNGLPPVGGLRIQYAQYLCRDIKDDGDPVTHVWSRRFYRQQRDAQLELYGLIEKVWQCSFDTVNWLYHRLNAINNERHNNGS